MLTVAQAKVLCNRGLHVRYNGVRVVWWEDGSSYADKQGRLLHAHSSDEAGEDWQRVPEDFEHKPEGAGPLTLVTAGPSYGGYFHVIPAEGQTLFTRVVQFDNPVPAQEGHHTYPYLVVVHSVEKMSHGDACEQAIDFILTLTDEGFDETNCHPVLVV